MIKVRNIFVGCYVGSGQYEGGMCHNRTYRLLDSPEEVCSRIEEQNPCSEIIEFDYEVPETNDSGHFCYKF